MKLKWIKEDNGEYRGFEEKVNGSIEKDHLRFHLYRETPNKWYWQAETTSDRTIISNSKKSFSTCKKDAEEFANRWEIVIQ